MYEIECPHCGRIMPVDSEPDNTIGNIRDALNRGERPKVACFSCWQEHEQTDIPEPSVN
jgi:hypothetical protein